MGKVVLLIKYFPSDQIKNIDMGRHVPCNGERRGAYSGFGVNMKERNYSEDLVVDGMIVLK